MKSGIYAIGMQEYLAIPALSSGLCHTLLSDSPAHALYQQKHPTEANSAMDIGTLAHGCLLEGGMDNVRVFDPANFPNAKGGGVATGWTNKAIRTARDEARANGEIPMLMENYDAMHAMVTAALIYIDASEIAGIFDSGKPEQTIIWQEGDTLCKARPDWLSDTILLHYKTTQGSVNPRAFSRVAESMGYDVALEFYMRGLEAIQPEVERDHYILAQEASPPYACKLFDLTSAKAEIAQRRVERALRIWAACGKSGKWPAYDGRVFSIDVTSWELAQAEQDAFTDQELKDGIPL